MKYESVQQAREALKKLEQTQAAYNHALGVLYLDCLLYTSDAADE